MGDSITCCIESYFCAIPASISTNKLTPHFPFIKSLTVHLIANYAEVLVVDVNHLLLTGSVALKK
jgi:hypothetical protein